MADNTVEPAPKKKKYLVKFNDAWCSKYKFITKSRKGEHFALCTICGSDLVLEEVGRMILVSTTLLKHTRNMWRRKQNRES